MREREGLIAIVAAAGIISALLFVGLNPREPNLPAYHYGERASADYQTGGASCDPRALATIRDNGKATIERKRCAEAAEEHRLKSEDLVQQARAADAAQAQTWLNFYLARMALWGTIGGFLTLIAASLAAFYARDAAKASRGSLQAFVAAEDAHLVLDFAQGPIGRWTGEDGVEKVNYSFMVTVSNVGRSAARLQQVIFSYSGGRSERGFGKTLKADSSLELIDDWLLINADDPTAMVQISYATSLHSLTQLDVVVGLKVLGGLKATAFLVRSRTGRPKRE